MQLAHQWILLTGASGGLGKELAQELSRKDAKLILVGRRLASLEAVQQACLAVNPNCQVICLECDLSDSTCRKELIKEVKEKFSLSVLINCAGMGEYKLSQDYSMEEIEAVFELNTLALIELSQAFLPHFSRRGGGAIVQFASQSGKLATPKSAIYSASKAAVIAYSNALRLEMKEKKIHVMTVNTSSLMTDFFIKSASNQAYLKDLGFPPLEVSKTVKKIVEGIENDKREVNLPLYLEWASRFAQVFPKLADRILQKKFAQKA